MTDKYYQSKRNWYEKNSDYVKAKSRERRDKMRQYVIDYKKQPCSICGEEYPFFVMDLHHREPDKKESTVAKLVRDGASWKRLEDELEKCDVVCANCHRLIAWEHLLPIAQLD